MNIAALIKLANRLDAKGLHSLADEVDQLISEAPHSVPQDIPLLEKVIARHKKPIQDLIVVADRLDKKGLTVLADKVDRIIELEALEQQSAVDVILSVYKKKHVIAQTKDFCKRIIGKTAGIRKNNLPEEQRCPFGLSIPGACMNAGAAIHNMIANPEEFKNNRTRYNKEKEGKPCPFAAEIFKQQRGVDCTYGTPSEGQKPLDLFHSSPIYPKMWEGYNSSSGEAGYFQYHDVGFSGQM